MCTRGRIFPHTIQESSGRMNKRDGGLKQHPISHWCQGKFSWVNSVSFADALLNEFLVAEIGIFWRQLNASAQRLDGGVEFGLHDGMVGLVDGADVVGEERGDAGVAFGRDLLGHPNDVRRRAEGDLDGGRHGWLLQTGLLLTIRISVCHTIHTLRKNANEPGSFSSFF